MGEVKNESETAKELAGMAKAAVDNMEDGIKSVEQATGEEFATVTASVSKKRYKIVPCSLRKVPELVGHIKTFDELNSQMGKEIASEYDLISNEKWTGAITSIILMSLHPDEDMTKDRILDEFNMADFPVVFQEALKLNDFLSRMRGVNMMRVQK